MKHIGIVATVAAITTLLAGCSGTSNTGAAPAKLTTVRVGYIANPNDIGQMFVAQQKGYFKQEGIQLKAIPFTTGISLSQALTGGSLDVGVEGAVIANFPAKGQGKLFLLNNLQLDLHQIWSRPGSGIKSISDLKGKTIATSLGTASDIILQVALNKAGLNRADIKVVNLDMPSVANTFVTGGVQAASLWMPFDQTIKSHVPDSTLLTTAGKLGFPIAGGWVANNDFYASHKTVLAGVIRAWQHANADLQADPKKMLDTYVCPKLKKNMTEAVCRTIWNATESDTNKKWAQLYSDGSAAKWITNMENVFKEIGAVKGSTMPVSSYFDSKMFAAALGNK